MTSGRMTTKFGSGGCHPAQEENTQNSWLWLVHEEDLGTSSLGELAQIGLIYINRKTIYSGANMYNLAIAKESGLRRHKSNSI